VFLFINSVVHDYSWGRELTNELISDASGSPGWFEWVDVKGLGNDVRRAIIERVESKLGFGKTLEALGITTQLLERP